MMKYLLIMMGVIGLAACSGKKGGGGTGAGGAGAEVEHEIGVFKVAGGAKTSFVHKFSRPMIIGLEGDVPWEEQKRLDAIAAAKDVEVRQRLALYLERPSDAFGIGGHHGSSMQIDPEPSGESTFELRNNSNVEVRIRVYWKEDASVQAAEGGGAKP
ncbi:hypothetical protein [Luteolibacter soli]|uniref:Lipoprotein n=1 Tax=Luteolibacter soli TaxID=3135280 RepID=A0ABU9AV15_9BACT